MQHELKSTPDKKNATTFNVGFQTQHLIPNTVLGNLLRLKLLHIWVYTGIQNNLYSPLFLNGAKIVLLQSNIITVYNTTEKKE